MSGTFLIAIGNPLRGDDGVAVHALEQLRPSFAQSLSVQQLTAELAAEIAPYDRVLFLDADVTAAEVRIEPVSAKTGAAPLSHSSSPGEIVALAAALYGFTGQAFVCRLPAADFSPGVGLSATSESAVAALARELGQRGF